MRILIFFSVLLFNLQLVVGEEGVPIRQSLPMKKGEGLGTKGYSPLKDELPFVKKITEKEINLWAAIKMPKATNISDAEWKKMEEKRIESEKNLIPIENYELAKQAGVYVGWFGIVRSLKYDADSNQTQLLVEHKYFDGLTDLHLQIISINGAGDFQVVVPGEMAANQIPNLGLIRAYGLVSKNKDDLPLVQANFIRTWDWGLFAFMAYGKDKSNPEWAKLRKVAPDDVYSSAPDNDDYYEKRLGNRFARRLKPGEGELKSFLNLDAPKTALNSPMVWSHNGQTFLAGLYYRDGKRDVSVLRLDGKNWIPVGTNGLAITGVGGNFLLDVAFDANKTPWILTYYTHPSNADRGHRFFLYTLKEDQWVIAGPKEGHPQFSTGKDGLFLLDRKTPVLFYQTLNSKKQYEFCVDILRNDIWESSKFATLLEKDSQILFHDTTIYVVRDNGMLRSIHEVKSLDVSELPPPLHQFKIDDDLTLGRIFVRDRDRFVIQLFVRDPNRFVDQFLGKDSTAKFRLFTKSGNQIESRDISPPDKDAIVSLGWTPRGETCVATYSSNQTQAYVLQNDDRWKLVGKAIEPTGAVIFDPKLAILPDGKPVVTWEEFYPRH